MAVDPFIPGSYTARRNGNMFVQMRTQMEDLQRQLATGKRADSFSDLGVERRISLDARTRISALEGWTQSIDQGDLRIRFMMQSIEGFAKTTLDGKSDARPGAFVVGNGGQVAGQILARDRLSRSIDMLNAEVNGRYLFSGRTHDVKPVESFETIMNGNGAGLDGIRTMISERQQADAGVGNLGRLASTVAGASVNLARETGNPPYGYTIRGATSGTAAIAATFTAGTPATASFNVAANPAAGDKITFALNLPDGSVETIELEARTSNTSGPADTGFTIGATPAATAANLGASIEAALKKKSATALNAASATVAARAFFAGTAANPPVRVPGPGFATATAPPAMPVPNTTVIWYKGDAEPAIQARNTAPLQVDSGQVVATGARANEEAFREGLAAFAVYASADFTENTNPASPLYNPVPRDRYEAIAERVRTTLTFASAQKPQDIGMEIAAAQVSMKAAKERHTFAANFFRSARADVEDARQEEVASAILSMQTRLQASYQTTSILSRLSLVNYLG
jgi:flagellin-like hook-associated protein FlgL